MFKSDQSLQRFPEGAVTLETKRVAVKIIGASKGIELRKGR
ncbi:MAG TPA: hypothetical protein VN643_25160 [Pyrinomonadaceae bacterium]|nr:hypothetical protein [Pyrinomonadaceae bacterium]